MGKQLREEEIKKGTKREKRTKGKKLYQTGDHQRGTLYKLFHLLLSTNIWKNIDFFPILQMTH